MKYYRATVSVPGTDKVGEVDAYAENEDSLLALVRQHTNGSPRQSCPISKSNRLRKYRSTFFHHSHNVELTAGEAGPVRLGLRVTVQQLCGVQRVGLVLRACRIGACSAPCFLMAFRH